MKGVPERILEELTIKALHLTEFDSDIFREKVKEIIIPEANKVRMILTNGKENEYLSLIHIFLKQDCRSLLSP